MKPYILGAIFARGGSKGVLKKNIRVLSGKPLLAYAIESGLAVSLIDRLIVSTDDNEIATIAQTYGVEVPFMRPQLLAGDHSPEILSWQHAIRTVEKQTGQKIDVLVSIPPTSPLRAVEDINRCITKLLESDADVVVTVKEADRNPYFNMVKIDKNDNVELVIPAERNIEQRQQAPQVYDMTTVAYAARAGYVLKASSLFEGKTKAVEVSGERGWDIDTMLDFEIAEFLVSRRKKNNEIIA